MRISGFDIDEKILVVAEIGNNHEGSYALAEELIGLAAEAGAGAVKFQTFRAEKYVRPEDKVRYQALKSFELSAEEFQRLSKRAQAVGLIFLSTPFDIEAVELLDPLVPAFKIASGDNTFTPLIEKVAGKNKPIILSTGLADWGQIVSAKALIARIWSEAGAGLKPESDLALLHCVSAYPTPPEEANLALIPRLRAELGCPVGYSDHTLGIEAAVLSAGLGARIIEKHFTISHHYSGFRDHQLSAEPEEFAKLVRRIREAEVLLGDHEAIVSSCERAHRSSLRRSIVAARNLPAGHILTIDDLSWTRPGDGLPPGQEDLLLGRTTLKGVSKGQALTLNLVSKSVSGLPSPSPIDR